MISFSACLDTTLFASEKLKGGGGGGCLNISLLTENFPLKEKQFMHNVYLL